MFNGRQQRSRDGTSWMMRECQVRFCERSRGEIPRAYSAKLRGLSSVIKVFVNVSFRRLNARNASAAMSPKEKARTTARAEGMNGGR